MHMSRPNRINYVTDHSPLLLIQVLANNNKGEGIAEWGKLLAYLRFLLVCIVGVILETTRLSAEGPEGHSINVLILTKRA